VKRLDLRKIVLDVLRQGLRALGRMLSTIPAGWLVVMGILALPIAILSVVIALVFFVLVALLAVLALLFYLLVWRPVFGTRRRQEKVIEAEYTVKSDDDQ
jgi:membrane protein implicated in regulation of membrane protease activity